MAKQLPPPSFSDMPPAVSCPSSAPFLHHQRQLPPPHPSWADEFLDFSTLRRWTHRRSASDSVAFLDAAAPEQEAGTEEFSRLDDEQLMSMFSDELSAAAPPTLLSSPSTPSSDKNSNGEEKAVEPVKALKVESPASNADIVTDPKRVKR